MASLRNIPQILKTSHHGLLMYQLCLRGSNRANRCTTSLFTRFHNADWKSEWCFVFESLLSGWSYREVDWLWRVYFLWGGAVHYLCPCPEDWLTTDAEIQRLRCFPQKKKPPISEDNPCRSESMNIRDWEKWHRPAWRIRLVPKAEHSLRTDSYKIRTWADWQCV